MDFEFAPDALMLRDMLRRFVLKEARPLEMKYFNTGTLTLEERAHLRAAIEQLGLWGVSVPEKFGGGGLDVVTACLIEEELGQTIVPIEMGEVPPLLFACAPEQVPLFLEPALAGARRAIIAAREPGALRPEAWQATATADDDAFILNGCKCLAARPGPDDFFVVFANAPAGLTAFLLGAQPDGVSAACNGVGAARNGESAARNGESLLTLRDCRVGREAVLGEPGRALALGSEEAPRASIRAGARYVGLVVRLIEMATEHAESWVALGAPLAARMAVRRMLAEMRAEVESARWLVYHAAWLADKGQAAREAAAQVRMFTGAMLQRAVDRATLIYTGPGPSPEIAPQRLARSVVPAEALELTLEYASAAMLAERQ
jgi:acyl-CoA dehydrogenase